jgi:hypothetical protein
MNTIDALTATLHAIRCVTDERGRQLQKWGVQNHSPLEWMAILVEEVGEAQKEALEHHWAGRHYPHDPERLQRLRAELVQVAAVAVAIVESLDRNEIAGAGGGVNNTGNDADPRPQ